MDNQWNVEELSLGQTADTIVGLLGGVIEASGFIRRFLALPVPVAASHWVPSSVKSSQRSSVVECSPLFARW
jgi:hypothetical protein